MDYSSYDRTATIPDGWIRSGLSAVQDDRRNSYPAKQDDRSRNGFLTIQDDRRNGYLTKQDDRPTNGFRATYGGTFYDEVPLPEEKPPPPGFLSYYWTIPGSYFTSWLGGTNETPRLEGGSSAGGIRADIQRPPIYNRGLDSEHSRHNESNPMLYGGFESREVNGVHLGKVDRTSPGIDDHGQRFPVRNEAHVNDFEVKKIREPHQAVRGGV